jgi:uncharacterized protein YbjT (DUF2867 family)
MIIVTGASGTVGSALLRALAARRMRTRALVRRRLPGGLSAGPKLFWRPAATLIQY